MRSCVLALFAKAPLPGQVKTRLSPPLRPEEAAALYEAMLLDIIDLHRSEISTDRALWFTPPQAEAWFRGVVPPEWTLHAQSGPDLGARMARLFRTHAAEGYGRIVLRGTDSPTLPAARVPEAFHALEANDLVLCPDRDGGYNLIGLRGSCDPLFDLEMSTGSVLDGTLERARELELRYRLLPDHYDVDTAADLALLRADADSRTTPRTLRWLRSTA